MVIPFGFLPADAEGPGEAEVPVGEAGVLWVKGDSVPRAIGSTGKSHGKHSSGIGVELGTSLSETKRITTGFAGRADHLLKISGTMGFPIGSGTLSHGTSRGARGRGDTD